MATRFSKGGREFHCTRSRHAVPAHTALHQQLQTIRTSWSSQQPPAAACSGTSSNRFAHTHGIINILLHDHQGSYTRQHRHRCSPQRLQTSAVPETAAGITTTGTTSYAWSSFVSRRINLDLALEEAIAGATANRDPDWAPELAIVFLSSAYVAEYGQLVQLLRTRIPSLQHVFGSTGYGVIGSTHEGPEEIEHAPSLSLTLASLPGVHLSIKHVTQQQLPDGDAPPDRWADLVGVHLDSEASDTNFIILADPEFHKLMELTAGLDFAFPAANKIGGLVSSGKLSPARAMFAWSQTAEQQLQQQQEQQQTPVQPDDQQQQEQQSQVQHQPSQQQQQQQLQQQTVVRTGAVVLSLQGSVQMELLVAQGCRPLSDNIYTIDKTASHSSVVLGLRDDADRALTPVEALQRELQKAANSKTELLQLLQNMALGIMPDTLRSSLSSSSSEGASSQPEPQDFLIRGVALDKSGFMVVGDAVRAGQKIRFMVRDREGAQQDLTSHCLAYKKRELAASMAGQPRPQVFGMLLFSCNGRGMNLYDEPSYDSRTLASYIPVPCAGFMCNGEIGTVGSSTHLHGFTCAAAVLKAAPSPHHDAAVEPAE